MKEGEPVKPSYELTHDAAFQAGGVSWARGAYRIRIFEKPGAVPIVLAADASEKPSGGVAQVTQFLAADVLTRHFIARLWEDEPMRWIEEETKLHEQKGAVVERREYWEVRFRSFVPRRVKIFGVEQYQIAEASRRKLKAKELQDLLGLNLS